MRMQVYTAELLQLRRVHGLGEVAGRHDHRVEYRLSAVSQLHFPLRRLARRVECRPDLRHPAPEPDMRRDTEMLRVTHQVTVHVDMIGEGLRGGVEIQVAETGDAARGIDVQGAIGGRATVVVAIAPHAADLAADLVYGDIETGFKQVFGIADAAGTRADHCDAFGAAPVWPGNGRIKTALIDRLRCCHVGKI